MRKMIAMVGVSLALSIPTDAAGLVRLDGVRIADGAAGSSRAVTASIEARPELRADGSRRLYAAVATDTAGRFELAAETSPSGRLALVVAAADGREQSVYLDAHRFLVNYRHGATLYTTTWLQPKGDLFEIVAAAGKPDAAAPLAFPFRSYPLHRLALAALDEVWQASFEAVDPALLAGATAVYAEWMADRAPASPLPVVALRSTHRAAVSDGLFGAQGIAGVERRLASALQATIGTVSEAELCEVEVSDELARLEPYANDPELLEADQESGEFQERVAEECGCIVPRSGTATATSASASIAGVSASLSAASVNVAALCYPDHSLASSATAGAIAPSVVHGSTACPAGSDPVGGSEIVEVTMQYSGSARVFPRTNCCHNGPTDTATGATATISFGGQSATLNGPTASGDWIRGTATVEATGKVCYEDDLIFDDLLSITITGSSTASGS